MSKRLPVDDGRGPDEEWPWRRSDDFSPRVNWTRCSLLFLVVSGSGITVARLIDGEPWVYAVSLGLAGLAAAVIAWHDSHAWPEWRKRNLVAADYRANRSIEAVDPVLAADLGLGRTDPDAEGSSAHTSQNHDRPRRAFPEPPLSTGPTFPSQKTYREEDELPF